MVTRETSIYKLQKTKNQNGHITYNMTVPKSWVDDEGLGGGAFVKATREGNKVIIEKVA